MTRPGIRPRASRAVISAMIAATVVAGIPSAATAVPAPPPNPSQSQIDAQRSESASRAGQVGVLTNRLAEAEDRLEHLGARVEAKQEDANKARVDLQRAEKTAHRAQQAADGAAADSAAASRGIDQQRARLDRFVGNSYRQGSNIGSLTAYVGAQDPRDVLVRAEMLDVISQSQRDVLDDLQRARVDKANKDSRAKVALREAEGRRSAADAARSQVEAAKRTAIEAQSTQQAQTTGIESSKREVQDQLTQARATVSGLEGQRDQYQQWVRAKQREEAAAAAAEREAAQEAAQQQQAAQQAAAQQHSSRPSDSSGSSGSSGSSSGSGSSGSSGSGSSSSSHGAETVINRALNQVGTTYAWGGGDSDGPTRGIRDGGVADSYGDYRKTGFDCSGLMVYSFAAAGIELDHYSGYQYQAGKQVPLSQMKRGDMLFWRDGSTTHHVALYLGNGKMVEAPQSGSKVRVSSVRYGGIAPYAVRMF